MGAFNINITGVGGHGCDRSAKEGEKLFKRCGRYDCPDCVAFEFVQTLRMKGMVRDGDSATGQELKEGDVPPAGAEIYHTDAEHRIVDGPSIGGRTFWRKPQQALFTHWPDSPSAVVDDLLKNVRRSGHF